MVVSISRRPQNSRKLRRTTFCLPHPRVTPFPPQKCGQRDPTNQRRTVIFLKSVELLSVCLSVCLTLCKRRENSMDRQSVEKSVSVSMLRRAATHRQYVEITNEPVCLSVINCTPHRRIHNRPLHIDRRTMTMIMTMVSSSARRPPYVRACRLPPLLVSENDRQRVAIPSLLCACTFAFATDK
jgi:hypothetical protein